MYGEAKLAFFVYLWYPKTKVCNLICKFIFDSKFVHSFSLTVYFSMPHQSREQLMFMAHSLGLILQNMRQKLIVIC